MPVHKIPAPSLHEDLLQLEREGESVTTITPVADGSFFVVTTRFHGNNIETRLARDTHQARIGIETRDPLLSAFIADGIVQVAE